MTVQKHRGYTLVELVIVVSIIGLIAMIAVPQSSSNDPYRLSIATAEFADAMRFARAETMRLGVPHGFTLPADSRAILLFRLDSASIPATPVYDVRHPISKQLYQIELDNHPYAGASSVLSTTKFRGNCPSPDDIYFDKQGVPRCFDLTNALLRSLDVKLQLAEESETVSLDGFTGRVTVQ